MSKKCVEKMQKEKRRVFLEKQQDPNGVIQKLFSATKLFQQFRKKQILII